MDDSRLYSLDWLRPFVILLLIPFHAAIVYTPNGGSYMQAMGAIRATGGSLGMAALSGFLWEWFMPLLFFISGVSAWYALGRHRGPIRARTMSKASCRYRIRHPRDCTGIDLFLCPQSAGVWRHLLRVLP